MNAHSPADDHAALHRCTHLLDQTARTSRDARVALHALAAADALAAAGFGNDPNAAGTQEGPASPRDALALFATLSPGLLTDDAVLDALDQTLLAHLADR